MTEKTRFLSPVKWQNLIERTRNTTTLLKDICSFCSLLFFFLYKVPWGKSHEMVILWHIDAFFKDWFFFLLFFFLLTQERKFWRNFTGKYSILSLVSSIHLGTMFKMFSSAEPFFKWLRIFLKKITCSFACLLFCMLFFSLLL